MQGPKVPALDIPKLTIEESKKLMSGPFGENVHRLVVNHMSYLCFGTTGPHGEVQSLKSATCFFLQTSHRIFGVTARHVIEAFCSAKESERAVICQVGNLLIDPIERIIALGRTADIATFDISAGEIAELAKFPLTLWPPHPPDEDNKGVLLAGYPAQAISADTPYTRCFGIYVATAVAQRVTDRQLTCQIEWDFAQASALAPLPPRNYDTGGLSGGPMLSYREHNGISTFPLAGVISEGNAQEDKIIAERADRILSNGHIRD